MANTSKKQVKVSLVVGLIAIFNMFAGAKANTVSELATGVEFYNAGRLDSALNYFSQAVQREPGNAAAHYYFANSLARTDQNQRAVEEYRTCLSIQPTGTMASYCQQMLVALTQQASARSAAQGQTAVQVQDPDQQRRNAETEQRVQEALRDGQIRSNMVLNRAAQDLRDISIPGENTIDNGPDAGVTFVGDVDAVAQAESCAAQINAAARRNSQACLQQAQRRADEIKKDAEQKEKALNEYFANMQRQKQLSHSTVIAVRAGR